MADERVKRKIAAILSADVVGYGKLMEADEETTVRTMESYRKTVVSLIEQHSGRVIDSPGDNLLSEFASVVDAVQCAVGIQHVIKAKNAVLPEPRRMEFRIGINLGDVIEEGDRIYGDGVNLAARIESIADPGSICISGSAYEQIKSKLALGYEDLGERPVKNVSEPVRVYRIPIDARSSVKANRGRGIVDRKRYNLALGTTIVLLIVLGLAAASYYKPKPSSAPEITARNAATGPPERAEPTPSVSPADSGRALELVTIGSGSFFAGTKEGVAKAREMFEKATELDPRIAYAHAFLGASHLMEYIFKWSIDPESLELSLESLQTAISIDDSSSFAHVWLANAYRQKGLIEKAIDEAEKGISLNPDDSFGYLMLGSIFNGLGRAEEALTNIRLALRLSPDRGAMVLTELAWAYRGVGQYGDAIKSLRDALSQSPGYLMAHSQLAFSYLDQWRTQQTEDNRALDLALEAADTCVDLEKNYLSGHYALYFIHLQKKQHAAAIDEAKELIAISTIVRSDLHLASAYYYWSESLNYADRTEEAIEIAKKAAEINPSSWLLSHAYRLSNRLEEAATIIKRRLSSPLSFSDSFQSHVGLAILYSELDRIVEARAEAAEVLKLVPNFSVKVYGERVPYKDRAQAERDMAALRKAGLK